MWNFSALPLTSTYLSIMKAEELLNVISSINGYLLIVFSAVDIGLSSIFNSSITQIQVC